MRMLNPERKGEIAYILLKRRMGKEGLHLNRNEFKRSLGGDIANKIGVGKEELAEFMERIIRDLIEDTFRK